MVGNGAHILLLLLLGTGTRAYTIPSPFGRVDNCIYTCHHCFEGNVMVMCANGCIANDGHVQPNWKAMCPEFGMPLYFDLMTLNRDYLKTNEME